MAKQISKVAFGITSDTILPGEISNRLNIQPDSQMLKGEEIRPKTWSKNNFWEIESRSENEIDLHDHLYYLIDKIRPVANIIKELSIDSDIYFIAYIHVSSNESTPGVYLDRTIIEFMSDINAEIGIDITVEE
jgi:hypothetical protein